MVSASAVALLTNTGFTDIGAQAIHAITAHQQRYEQLRWAGLDDEQARAELNEFMTYAHSVPWPVERSWWDWQVRRQPAVPEPLTRWRPSIFGHACDVVMGRAGHYSVAPCACYPMPFPAARNYRCRTRHRNRRRKS